MRLMALRCPQCNHPLTPEHNEAVVTSCPHCFTAVSLSPNGLHTLEVKYAPPSKKKVDAWLPFWVFYGRAHISYRDTQGWRSRQEDSSSFWKRLRPLYVPACDIPLHEVQEIASNLIVQKSVLRPLVHPPEVTLVDAIITPEDGLKLLDFIVLSIEADREDWLKKIKFEVIAGPPELWAMPAINEWETWTIVF